MAKSNSKPCYISAVDQHIINVVRTFRYNLDLSQKKLSSKSNDSANLSLVGKAEGISSEHKYSDDQLHAFLHIFSAEAAIINNRFEMDGSNERVQEQYSMYDFYPLTVLPDVLVPKSISVISNKIYPTGALNYILDESIFFNSYKSAKEVTEFANTLFSKSWRQSDFGSPLDRFAIKGRLIKRELENSISYCTAKLVK
ncbi:hypothetical protein BDE36_2460 [Arcticibacter tournemirensis]|uniref:Uncharacterized protein n=1 Tax=Arcticibacter tournemirensis TaxID=699437 RepID=A0A5M9H4P6_9SPHI|nr:hypothetical protein [Arcticibacter tournemirensis]KAA8480098.1 hypothetical protein F1649_15890 [Arcticibacter tournemirensis]TQM50702.1 hypothetical protein BDE36_2460 [Arcticibacter tournemirensis]